VQNSLKQLQIHLVNVGLILVSYWQSKLVEVLVNFFLQKLLFSQWYHYILQHVNISFSSIVNEIKPLRFSRSSAMASCLNHHYIFAGCHCQHVSQNIKHVKVITFAQIFLSLTSFAWRSLVSPALEWNHSKTCIVYYSRSSKWSRSKYLKEEFLFALLNDLPISSLSHN